MTDQVNIDSISRSVVIHNLAIDYHEMQKM